MDTILQGIPNVMCYIDNILVIGADDQTHLRNLTKVLQHFKCLHCVCRLYIRSFAADAYTYVYIHLYFILTERVLQGSATLECGQFVVAAVFIYLVTKVSTLLYSR